MRSPGADIKLDGQPWLRRAGRRSMLVLPGEHYIAASKPGYFPVTRSVYVIAGRRARVAVPLDENLLIETRRWTVWKPWAVVAVGVAVAAMGAGLEWRAFANRDAAADALAGGCNLRTCDTAPSDIYDRAERENWLAIGAFAASGTAVAVGLALAWINQPRAHRSEVRAPPPIELGPILSPDRLGLSAVVRF